jgi:hypothetical protein
MTKAYEFSCGIRLDEVIESLRKYGIAHIPDFISKSEVDLLNTEFFSILETPSEAVFSQSGHPRNPEGRTARFFPWHKKALNDFPSIAALFRGEFIQTVARAYYAPHEVDVNDEVFITHEKPAEQPILPWHFDRVQSIKFWFYLTDTTVQNGAFEYCPGTHWEGHYRAGYHLSQGCAVEDIPNDIDEDLIHNPVSLELKAGDMLIFDSDGFHRGGVVQSGNERRVLRGHTHPKGIRRYGDKPLTAGWWLKSIFNINKWTGNASKRVLGESTKDRSINRKNNKA